MSAPTSRLGRTRDRIEGMGTRHGLAYPWWIPVLSTIGLIGAAVIGTAQRDLWNPIQSGALALVLIAAPCLSHFLVTSWLPMWWEALIVLGAVAWLLTEPLQADTVDVLPITLCVLVAEMTVFYGLLGGLVVGACSASLLVLVGDYETGQTWLHLGELEFGFVIGSMLLWQMRALAAEQKARDEEREHATLDERQRVAREIHDLVAHSLSVTMLHITGARRALSEDAGPHDVADAIEALTEAERIGRQAMADIRRTVSVLADDDADTRPLPGATDLDALVAEVRTAGVQIDWSTEGDLDRLSPAAGLGLYRVVQESLANAAKHAPGAPVVVRLAVGQRTARLSVVNAVLAGAAVGSDGSGLTGMASRVDQLGGGLSVGPDGDRWRVDLAVPVDSTTSEQRHCVVRRLLP